MFELKDKQELPGQRVEECSRKGEIVCVEIVCVEIVCVEVHSNVFGGTLSNLRPGPGQGREGSGR